MRITFSTFTVRSSISGQTNGSSHSGGQGYRSWLKAFCDRKYNSDFSREMTRSVKKYLDDFSTIGWGDDLIFS